MNRQTIVNKAREFLETPYHHQGRIKGVGIDCAGLLICVAHELELSNYDINNYPKESNNLTFQKLLNKNAVKTDYLDLGNIILFQFKQTPQHCGIIALKDDITTFIHACRRRKKVIEIELTKKYIDKIVNIYEFPNLDKI